MRVSAPKRGLPIAVTVTALVIAAWLFGWGGRGGGDLQDARGGDSLTRPAEAQEMEGAPAGAPPSAGPAPAEPPTPEQIALVEQAVAILRTMTTPDVPPPPPLPPGVEPAVIERAPRPAAPAAPAPTPGAPSDMPMMEPGMMMDPSMGPPGEMPMDPGMAPPMDPGMMPPGAALPGDMQPSGPGRSREYRIAQADGGPPPMGPPDDGPGDAPPMAAPGPSAPAAGTGREMTPMALALELKTVCQKTRGIQMMNQKWFHEYWYFMATGLLKEVAAGQADFAGVMVPLVHAAQVKSDWEGYLWHWAVRAMLAQGDYDSLKQTAELVAKARTALATIRAISRHGLLMQDVDQTKLGRLTAPTIEHVANCVQFSFGNPNYDPATVERDETLRSRLMVEVFDNYYALGHNWYWERSRNWAYLSRVTNNLPAYTCDSCGNKMTRDGQMWRCTRCGKGTRPAIPGTLDTVPTHECLQCGHKDQYRVKGMRCPACGDPEFSYRLDRGWNAPTFARGRQGLLNAQHVHARLQGIFAEDNPLPTKADRSAYQQWAAASPAPEWVPPIHTQELVFHEERLGRAAMPSDRGRQTD